MNVTSLKQYRASQEDFLRAELAELQRAVDHAEAVRQRLEQAALEQVKNYLAQAKAGLTADEALLWNDVMTQTAQNIARAAHAVGEARQRLDAKREETLDAARETRKLEILERRDLDRQRRTEQVRSQRQLDDIAGRQFQTRRRESHGPNPR